MRYPNGLVWPLAVAAAGLVGAAAIRLRRDGLFSPRRLGWALASVAAALMASILAAVLAWRVLAAGRAGYADLAVGDTFRPAWSRLGFVVLALAVLSAWYIGLRQRLGSTNLQLAGLIWLAGLGLLLAAAAPGAAYLFTLPALAGALGLLLAASVRARMIGYALRPTLHLIAALITAAVAVPVVALLLPTLGLAGAAVPVLLIVMLAVPGLALVEFALPQRRDRSRWLPTMICLALAVAAFGVGATVDRFDADHPRPSSLIYTLDADTGAASWRCADRDPSDWTRRYVRQSAPVQADWPVLHLPGFATQYLIGPAEPASLPAPELTVLGIEPSGAGRVVTLELRSVRLAPVVSIWLARTSPLPRLATVDGVEVPVKADPEWDSDAWSWGLRFHALPQRGISIVLTLPDTRPVTLRVIDESVGLAELPGFTPRPVGLGLTPLPTDVVLVGTTATI